MLGVRTFTRGGNLNVIAFKINGLNIGDVVDVYIKATSVVPNTFTGILNIGKWNAFGVSAKKIIGDANWMVIKTKGEDVYVTGSVGTYGGMTLSLVCQPYNVAITPISASEIPSDATNVTIE